MRNPWKSLAGLGFQRRGDKGRFGCNTDLKRREAINRERNMHNQTRRNVLLGGAAIAAGSMLPSASQAKDINLTLVSASPVQFVWNKTINDVFVPEVTASAKDL